VGVRLVKLFGELTLLHGFMHGDPHAGEWIAQSEKPVYAGKESGLVCVLAAIWPTAYRPQLQLLLGFQSLNGCDMIGGGRERKGDGRGVAVRCSSTLWAKHACHDG
jgi:hypothetical protein